MRTLLAAATILSAAATLCAQPPKDPPAPSPAAAPADPGAKPAAPAAKPADAKADDHADVLGFTVDTIDGKPVKLEQYRGKVLLIVNVASKCGNTPQYKGLEKLYEDKKADGLVILGFPANNFGGQEPGTNEQIQEFCTSTYQVAFPMFAKISVKGADQHPLYKKLTSQPKPIGGDPDWNFAKFVVDRSGHVVAHFPSRTQPNDAKLMAKLNELLAAKAPAAGTTTTSPAAPPSPKTETPASPTSATPAGR